MRYYDAKCMKIMKLSVCIIFSKTGNNEERGRIILVRCLKIIWRIVTDSFNASKICNQELTNPVACVQYNHYRDA
jgi:hypothetical protein